MANNFKFNDYKTKNLNNLGLARPFDDQYAHSILTGSIGSTAFSPLFFGDNVYTQTVIPENDPPIAKHGNVWIKLSGTSDPHIEEDILGDFAKAEEVAKDYGLFDEMPNDYVWHYVFMGWFNYQAFSQMDINQLQCIDTEAILALLKPSPTISHLYELKIAQGAYRNKEIKVLDARSWTNCFKHDFVSENNWMPDEDHYSLLQLVPKDLHDDTSSSSSSLTSSLSTSTSTDNDKYHYGCDTQYQTYYQVINTYRKYCYDTTITT